MTTATVYECAIPSRHRIYIACPAELQVRARLLGETIVAGLGNAEVVSTWHANPKEKYPLSPAERSQALAKNLSELERATVGVFLMDLGRPLTTIGELGFALARGIPVVMTKAQYSWQRTLFDAHGSVTIVPVSTAIETTAYRIAGAIEGWASVARASQRAAGVQP